MRTAVLLRKTRSRKRGSTRWQQRLATFSIRRPKLALTFWPAYGGVFVAITLGISDRLAPTMTLVPGSEASRAQYPAKREFGPSVLVPILLEGSEGEARSSGSGAGAQARGEGLDADGIAGVLGL